MSASCYTAYMQLDYTALSRRIIPKDVDDYYAWRGSPYRVRTLLYLLIGFYTGTSIYLTAMLFLGVMRGDWSLAPYGVYVGVVFAGMSILLPVALLSLQYTVRLYLFARDNHLHLTLDQTYQDHYVGMIFQQGHSRILRQIVSWDTGLEIGNYEYTTGSGKHSQLHQWGYAAVPLSRRLPHMVLDTKHNNLFGFSNLPENFAGQGLALEGDFGRYFTLYVPASYETDALYIFTPDVMAALIDIGNKYDIEIIDDTLFFYRSQKFNLTKETELQQLLGVVERITAELHSQSTRYRDQRVDEPTPGVVAERGRRLRRKVRWTVFIIPLAVLILCWMLARL